MASQFIKASDINFMASKGREHMFDINRIKVQGS